MLSQASKVTGIGLLALACGALLVPACGSGGSDDEPTAGSGGSGTGGNSAGSSTGGNSAGTATGGTAGATGGSGGNTMQVVTACPGVEPGTPLIADFDAGATAGTYEWGSADQGTMDFWGGTFNYPAALEVTFADGAMTAAGHVAEYAGFGLYVQNCADASAYEGVRFKI